MRCIICGQEKPGSKEHIIPEALGNSKLITYKVCKECNNRLGSKVDSYFLDHILTKMVRKNHGLKDRSGKPIKIFPDELTTKDGEQYLVRDDIPEKKPLVEMKDGVLHIETSDREKGLGIAKKVLERLGKSKEEISEALSTCEVGKRQNADVTFMVPANIDKARYLLAGIKIAYEYACETLGEEYYADSVAEILREQLYRASISDHPDEEIGDYERITKYAGLMIKPSIELKHTLEARLGLLKPAARHMVTLHGSADNKLICEIFLFLEDFMSYTVCVSENATKYLKDNAAKICIVLENEELISI